MKTTRRKISKAHLPEKSLTSTAGGCWIINVNIVVFRTDRLFHKWLLENFPIHFHMIFSLNQVAFFRVIGITVQNCIPRKQDAFSLQNAINVSSKEQRNILSAWLSTTQCITLPYK